MKRGTHSSVVTIDGPAGAGKSTVAMRLAQALGYQLLDTGAMYRAVALVAQRQGMDWDDEVTLAEIGRNLDISFHFDGDTNRVTLAGEDITAAIRTPAISARASQVSSLPAVREALLDIQRRLGATGKVVVEGRDTGTVVFPEAPVKFFLTASDEIRARRRHVELLESGADTTYQETLADLRERDERDSQRQVAPLSIAPDATLVDSSVLSLEAVLETMLAEVQRRQQIEP